MKIPFGKPFPGIDSTALRDGVAAGLVDGYIDELDGYPKRPGLTVFATHPDGQSIDSLYEALDGSVLAVSNGKVFKVSSSGAITPFDGPAINVGVYCYWAEDGQHVYLSHGGKLTRLDLTNMLLTLLNENTPNNVTHVCRSKGFLLCNGDDRIIGSTVFELGQVFDVNMLYDVVTLDKTGWMLIGGGEQTLPGVGRIYLSKDGGGSWNAVYEMSGPHSNFSIASLCYLGAGVVLAGTYGADFSPTGPTDYGKIWRSTDYGQTWTDLGPLGTNFSIAVLEKIAPGTVIAGGTDLFRSTDNGLTWYPVTPSHFANPVATCLVWDPSAVFIGTSATITYMAQIWKSIDAGNSFGSTISLEPGNITASVKVSSTVGLISLSTVPDGLGKIYRTDDSGATWKDIGEIGIDAGMIPRAFLLTSTGDLLFAASGGNAPSQIWKSLDGGLVWSQVNELSGDKGTEASTINAMAESHTPGQIITVGRINVSTPTDTKTAAKWQSGMHTAPLGDVFYSEDIANGYEKLDSWERFNAQSTPDAVNGVFENRALVYAAGPQSIEINYNDARDPGFPWQVSDPSLPFGLLAPNSWVQWDELNEVMYLTDTDNAVEVVRFQSREQQAISRQYATVLNDRSIVTSPQTARAWGVVIRGMPHYIITFPVDNLTLGYNLFKDHWWRWGFWNGVSYEAGLINSYVYSKTFKRHLVGDRRATGQIYELKGLTDAGNAIRYELTSGHIAAGTFFPKQAGRVVFKVKRGSSIDASVPVFRYQTRDNGNPTFRTGWDVSLGVSGETEFLGYVNRMGAYNTRQHRIVHDDTKSDFIFSEADES